MSMAQTLALMLTGVVAVPLLQLLKRLFRLSGPAMVWFTFFVSILLAVAVTLFTGDVSLADVLSEPLTVFGGGGVVMSVATVVYRTLKEKLNA